MMLLAVIVGPAIWNAMKNSTHTEDEYKIPVDDPVEHSVRILMDAIGKSDSDSEMQPSSMISPEEDAKRILSDLLAGENIRTNASRIASGVIQSPPFQNACLVLVKNIWDDLINDPETTSQLTTLVYTVLQNEKVYSAVQKIVLQLVNDEEVYRELTKLVVKLGEEQEVLDATQKMLTESAHKTLNDPDILDHSMEFATEVVGDDVVQRTGGEALRNTVGYAVQPSGGAVLTGIGTMIVAGVLHFYLRRGGGGGGSGMELHSRENSISSMRSMQYLEASPIRSDARDSFSWNENNHAVGSLFLRVMDISNNIVALPWFLVRSIRTSIMAIVAIPTCMSKKVRSGWEWSYGRLSNGVAFVLKIPAQLKSSMIESASSASLWVANGSYAIFSKCQVGIARTFGLVIGHVRNCPHYLRDSWSGLVIAVIEYMRRMRGDQEISPKLPYLFLMHLMDGGQQGAETIPMPTCHPSSNETLLRIKHMHVRMSEI
eukprot:CAMPEP_0183781684 /NCGR_PEP_ID=MMETSP0739-20130205/59343_1 /TAXON_ID=385413 /ORGANISM="Thalassiosira miniscula, Strain CCMP1093" /LENGTH=486 /DNA_ID=CAMNT_0026024939 /DNA_START=485 /DNA_END=1946 /DNA_ORIENTATION=+